MDRWKSRGGKSQRREEQKKEDQKRDRVRRQKMQVREQVGKSRDTVFFQWFVVSWPDERWKIARRCGAKHVSKSNCTKHTTFSSLFEVEMSKKCTPLWCEAHFEVKMYTTLHPGVVSEVTTATIATTPKSTTPTTFRSISGFALPSMHHNNSPLPQCPILEASATALCGTTGIYIYIYIYIWVWVKTLHAWLTSKSCYMNGHPQKNGVIIYWMLLTHSHIYIYIYIYIYHHENPSNQP